MKRSPIVLLLISGLFLWQACKTQLEPGGPYGAHSVTNVVTGSTNIVVLPADKAFWGIEMGFELAHNTLITIGGLERNNRELFWRLDPNIKRTLDRLRPQIVAMEKSYALARKAYLADPSPTGLSEMQSVLVRLQSLAAAITAALPKGN